jgi:hypothetical protein
MANMFGNDAAEFDSTAGATPRQPRATGFLTTLFDRLTLSRQRRVDSEVGAFLEAHGGQLTDDLERQISRKFGNQAGQW